MKFKNLLIILFSSLFFFGTESSTLESSDIFIVNYEVSVEVSEQVEEAEDNRSFLQSVLLLSHFTLDTYAIIYVSSFFLNDNFIDIEKPPIIS